MDDRAIDRKTAAFYLTLAGLIVFDLLLIFWNLSPLNHLETSAFASQKIPVVSDANKPSPFDIADAKRLPIQGARRKPRQSNAPSDTQHR